jgi:hypothetical protein
MTASSEIPGGAEAGSAPGRVRRSAVALAVGEGLVELVLGVSGDMRLVGRDCDRRDDRSRVADGQEGTKTDCFIAPPNHPHRGMRTRSHALTMR